MDEELAQQLLNREDAEADTDHDRAGISPVGYSIDTYLLLSIIDALMGVQAAIVAAAGADPPHVTPMPRPETAVDRVREQRRTASMQALIDLFTPPSHPEEFPMSIFEATLPAQAAGGADAITVAGVFEPQNFTGVTVSSVVVCPPAGYATVTGAATNNVTITVRQIRGGSVVAAFATLTLTTGVNLGAEIPLTVPVVVAPQLASGDVVDILLHQNGAGIALGAGLTAQITVS
ncbi:hypothetical protein [Nocardia terpenica]|uniref:hypothetical protein n=1 Tax=Nocardia terpenica TaxID=455432 RepID=UPI0012E8DE69|nr:hypothetical protein [Nocardia terpenica]NQE89017.1 hypothetical protein [Nocardia terpenica]